MNYQYSDFAQKHLGARNTSSRNIKVLCLFHDDSNPSMSFDQDTGLFLCFSCGKRGNIVTLAHKLGIRVEHRGESSFVPDLDDPAAEAAAFSRRMTEALADDDADLPTMPERSLTAFLAAETDYWTDRGLTDDTIAAWQLGYARFRNQAIIPVRAPFTDELRGVIRRNLTPGVQPKYLNPRGFPKNQTLFGSWMDADHDPDYPNRIVLGEGPMDAIKIWQAGFNGRAIMGSRLSRDQVTILLKYGVTEVILFLDDDTPGFKAAMSAYGRLHRKFEVSAAVYPQVRATDPGDLSSRQIRQAVARAVNMTSLFT